MFELTARILNVTQISEASSTTRDEALARSLFLRTRFWKRATASSFRSWIRLRPTARSSRLPKRRYVAVLVGEEGQRDTMLSSPIILYDYPQIAPESPGDLFDGAEIDEFFGCAS